MKNIFTLLAIASLVASFSFTQAQTICENGFADIYACDGYDLYTHFPLSAVGGGDNGNDCWGWVDSESGREFVLFGRSLGGGIASWMAARANPGALVLESAFASAPAMAAVMFPFLPTRLICRFKYDSVAAVAAVQCPVLVAHSRRDRTCPFSQSQRIFAAANEPKLFVEMQGGHNDGGLDSNPQYQATLKRFLGDHL